MIVYSLEIGPTHFLSFPLSLSLCGAECNARARIKGGFMSMSVVSIWHTT